MAMVLEVEKDVIRCQEDDHQRQGTAWTGTAHVVTAVIGSGVLALPWSVAQVGWAAGPVVLLAFACVTFYTSTLLSDCYRYPLPHAGKRNYTYLGVVRSYLGPKEVLMCCIAQYVNLWGAMVGYTITATASMIALQRSNCFHKNGHGARCTAPGILLMVGFGAFQLVLSQFPSLENITWMSMVAAAMSFAYSAIGLFLCAAKWASHGQMRGDLVGATDMSHTAKAWYIFQALGNIAFAYTYSEVLIEIQDTLKSPPSENKTMKRVTMYGIGLTTIFYLSLGSVGYAAFGNAAPGNILTSSAFLEPFWLVDVANLCVVIHLIGAYQVFAQPFFAGVEKRITSKWPEAKFIHSVYELKMPLTDKSLSFTMLRITLRSVIIMFTTLIAMLLPFFNAIVGLLGALAFWPLTVFFPVIMHITQRKIQRGTLKWFLLHGLSTVCFIISLLASVGSVADIVKSLKISKPFKMAY